jgi:CAAX protease family protein
MKKLAEFIRRHQLVTYFLISYAISWPLMIFYYYYIVPRDPNLGVLLEPFIVFSPALAAMLVSGVIEPSPKLGSGKSRVIAFILAWLVSFPILVLYGWKVYGISLGVAAIIYSGIALFPAWVLSSAYARTPGIRRQFSTIVKPRGPAVWYLVIFLIFPGIPLLGMGITRLMGGEAEFLLSGRGFGEAIFFLVIEFLHGFLLTGGINEESGWRGFALPRLQARYPVLISAAIVWAFWAGWHLPYDLGRNIPLSEMLINRLFFNLLASILLAWVYNRTNGSILAPALMHPAMNSSGFPITNAGTILLTGAAIFAIIYDRMWKKLPEVSLAVHHTKPQSG